MRVLALEGINGAGKSSVGRRLQTELSSAGRECLCLDPAGFGPVGQLLRIKDVAMSNRFEAKGPEYLDKVAQEYRQMAMHERDTDMIDASGGESETFNRVVAVLRAAWPSLFE